MNSHQQLAVDALREKRGDSRVAHHIAVLRDRVPEADRHHLYAGSATGETCQEVLDRLVAREKQFNDAIKWVEAQGETQ